MGDFYDNEGLHCTICQHDLNHPLYKTCSHPILKVPLCIICMDDLMATGMFDSDAKNMDDISSDFCKWCGDGGKLFMCSNAENGVDCTHSFCEDCLTSNLGKDTVRDIENSDDWYCLVCDPSQLSVFDTAMKESSAESIFGEAYQQQVLDSLDGEDMDNAEELLAISRLTAVVEECNSAADMLNNESVAAAKRREIRDEIINVKHEPGFE